MKLTYKSINKILENNNKIVCFGAGVALFKFIDFFENIDVANHIEVIVDNNGNMNGIIKKIKGHDIKVISFKEFINNKEYLDCEFVVTNRFLADMMEQFNQYELFLEKECSYYRLVIFENDDVYYDNYLPESLKRLDIRVIPKVIHYCWFGKGEMSELNKRCIDSWHKHCPEYEIVEWNEDNYNINKSHFMRNAYEHKMWAYVSDVARLDIIFNYGGIYLDTDVEIVKSLDELLYQEVFLGVDMSKRISLGLGFGAVPHMKRIRELYELYENIDFSIEKVKSKEIVIPNVIKDYFKQLGYVEDGTYQVIDGITVYPERVLSGYEASVGIKRITDQTYMLHMYEGSWAKTSEKEIVKKNKDLILEALVKQYMIRNSEGDEYESNK